MTKCSKLTQITIPQSVQKIGGAAFEDCQRLQQIIIPESVHTIGSCAFYGTGLQSLSIPASVLTIYGGAFRNCENLDNLRIEDSEHPLDTRNAFDACQIATLYYGRDVFDTGSSPDNGLIFYGSKALQNITIGEKVTRIHDNMFNLCPMITEVKIPAACKRIGWHAFNHCDGLQTVVFEESDDRFVNIEEGAFKDCSNLSQLVLPKYSIKIIGSAAFVRCVKLSSLSLPNSLEEIGDGAFYGCTGLTEIKFGHGIKRVGGFEGCTGLRSVDFPEQVTSISSNAFRGCTGLEEITFNPREDGVEIGSGAFSDCVKLKHINNLSTNELQRLHNYLADGAFKGCTNLEEVTVNGEYFGDEVFAGCTALKNVSIEIGRHYDDYGRIGASAFDNCPIESLTLNFNNRIKQLKDTPFKNIATIKKLTIGGRSDEIVLKPKEFEACKNSLKTLTLDCQTLSICEPFETDSLFYGCSNIKYVDSHGYPSDEPFGVAKVNKSLKYTRGDIPENAFEGSQLETAYLNGGGPVGNEAFKNCGNMRLVSFWGSYPVVIGANAFAGTKIENIVTRRLNVSFEESSFDEETYDNTHVYYTGYYLDYQDNNIDNLAKSAWSRFKNIDGIPYDSQRFIRIPLYLNEPENLWQMADSVMGVKGLSFDYALREYPSDNVITDLSEYMEIRDSGVVIPKKLFIGDDFPNNFDGLWSNGIRFIINGYCPKLDIEVRFPFLSNVFTPTREIKISSYAGAKVLKLSEEAYMEVAFNDDANPYDVIIKSSDATVVTTADRESGRWRELKPLSLGHARITAMSKRHPQIKDSVDVYVLDPKFKFLEEHEIYLRVGENAKLNVKIPDWMPWEGIEFREYWAQGSFSVDQDGVITAHRPNGLPVPEVELYFKGEKLASCRVHVYETSDISDAELGDVEIKEIDGAILVKDVPNNVPVKIYGVSGLPLYDALSNGEDILFSPEAPGFYIVSIAGKSYKIIVR